MSREIQHSDVFSVQNFLQNSTEDIISSIDYKNNTNHYRRIKTIRTNDDQLIGNSIFTVSLLIFQKPLKT
jgi:hypothetical protein